MRPLDDHDIGHCCRALKRFIDNILEAQHASATPATICSDHTFRAVVVDAVTDRLRGESGKNHRMDRADARTGQYRQGQLRHHRQVNGDAVALADAQLLQAIGKFADLPVHVLIGQYHVFRRARPPRGVRPCCDSGPPGGGRHSCSTGWCAPRKTTCRTAHPNRRAPGPTS